MSPPEAIAPLHSSVAGVTMNELQRERSTRVIRDTWAARAARVSGKHGSPSFSSSAPELCVCLSRADTHRLLDNLQPAKPVEPPQLAIGGRVPSPRVLGPARHPAYVSGCVTRYARADHDGACREVRRAYP